MKLPRHCFAIHYLLKNVFLRKIYFLAAEGFFINFENEKRRFLVLHNMVPYSKIFNLSIVQN